MGIWGVFQHCSTLLRLTLYIVGGQNLGIWGVFHCSTLLRLTLYIVPPVVSGPEAKVEVLRARVGTSR